MAKLTLYVEDQLIALAKNEASSRGVSVSKLVSDFFVALATKQPAEHAALPPLTQSLVGILKGSESDREDYIDYLEDKHS